MHVESEEDYDEEEGDEDDDEDCYARAEVGVVAVRGSVAERRGRRLS
ncbi:putative E3 ubiquitin-protein ligase ATL6 [Iris pallida]|uniref:E3 ubiquitin-protein ligase ATL6 n=1 Tax=Iris pallida TaxID=29817 RepID=A0AAX6FD79_IRIPA|nr:putative E3 ubiquitin-protein ligase ATL6 [Iris pallida]KAJ6813971.1 putative E3 ubiquitin-protein ligase ATL6 [Iris pallida]KAJ6833828.1 putative E3 ubiquitin-protein ligase ATL6 [Iris pallida]